MIKVILRCAGRSGGWIRRFWKRIVLIGALLAVVAIGSWESAIRLVPIDLSVLDEQRWSTIVLDHEGRELQSFVSSDDRWRLPVSGAKLSPWVAKATIAAEDKRFYQHAGIDWVATARAAWGNLWAGRVVSGASTLSMQVAGFTIKSRERTLSRKLLQAFRAQQIEMYRSKEEILELYLVHASYGGNICGIEAASRRYFNKPAEQLSSAESALLASIPQSPERLRPDRHPHRCQARAMQVLARMERAEFVTADRVAELRQIVSSIKTRKTSVKAPHFARFVKRMHKGHTVLDTTLDLAHQQLAERLLRDHLKKLAHQNVGNGAILVVANKDRAVRAMVGSANFFDVPRHGQVNATIASRSPGSTLKPFIYAAALAEGQLFPGEILYDVPTIFTEYRPKNFDRNFHGLIPAEEALVESRNIPAITLINRLGTRNFDSVLARLGFPMSLGNRNDSGLSIAIGTSGVRMLDLVNAYATMAEDGVYRPVRTIKLAPGAEETSVALPIQSLPPWACKEVLHALAQPRAGIVGGYAWKTGTSNGLRDVWTIAVGHDYSVGVWLGNMSGKPMTDVSGATVAAPLALDIIQRIDRPRRIHDAAQAVMVVCADSGLPADSACITTATVTVPPQVAEVVGLRQKCRLHRWVELDRNSGHLLCGRCRSGKEITTTRMAFHPEKALGWLQSNDLIASTPSHHPGCRSGSEGSGPVIVSPTANSNYHLVSFLDVEMQKLELRGESPEAGSLYWFVSGVPVGSSSSGLGILWSPVPGEHEIRCVDENGRSSKIKIQVSNVEEQAALLP